jgi:hypothetical protein
MSKVSGLTRGRLLTAALALSPMATVGVNAQQFIPNIIVSSTVPAKPHADLNPYGVAFVPSNFPTGGAISPGDILVSNFNDPKNVQGTGRTIISLTPNGIVAAPMTASIFFTSKVIGLTTALGVLQRGFVVVGNLPNANGTLSPGSLQFIDLNGQVVKRLVDPLIDGPWDLTIDDDPNQPIIYVSNVLNGTVVRLNLTLSDTSITVSGKTTIAAGYTFAPNAAALVLGPTGLAHDLMSDILYVASTADNAIFAIPSASTTSPSNPGTGTMIAQGGQLRGPLALALAPNGNLVTSNGDAVNPDPTQPSEIVELTKSGQFVGQFNVDAGQGGAFGVAISAVNGNTAQLAFVDDNANDITVIAQNVVPGG